tara:strand:+ start:35 stop:541 length:507 start_codon:yes stop_codon:yes gene_type:complete
MSDTVGFIQNLPHDLVASFRSTLGEIKNVDLLLMTHDASSKNLLLHIDTVNGVLNDLDVKDKKTLTIFNKIDLINEDEFNGLKKRFKDGIFISATCKTGIDTLKDEIESIIKENFIQETLLIPYDKSTHVNSFYKQTNVISKKDRYDGTEMTIEGEKGTIEKLKNMIK